MLTAILHTFTCEIHQFRVLIGKIYELAQNIIVLVSTCISFNKKVPNQLT